MQNADSASVCEGAGSLICCAYPTALEGEQALLCAENQNKSPRAEHQRERGRKLFHLFHAAFRKRLDKDRP